jgi:carbon-monoxide dehydrogenase medium subunit
MQSFQFSNAKNVAEAKAAAASGAKILAGGQSLLPSMRLGLAAPDALASLGHIADLKGITVAGGVVKIGAMTTHATVAASAEVRAATVHTDRRDIAADDFFVGLYTTGLAEDEIITAVSFPVPEKAGWQKFKQPASRFSIVGVFTSKGPKGVRVAVTGAGSGVFRATELEAKLSGNYSAAALAGATVSAEGMNSDLHGSAEYRAALVPVLAARAVG